MLGPLGRLLDHFGKWDDNSVIYRADDPEQKVHWLRLALTWVVARVVAALLIAGAGFVVEELAGAIIALALTVVFLVIYVIWRRRRNQRLTGSPTTWPSA
ncbi:MAG TPA: hypothetical protein VK988_11380 [Acidimicrobiales bacterium]|nr:hypothetical protein [Acidimicrobiales bacterium]